MAAENKQLYLVDPHPEPSTWEEAEKFLRQQCKTVVEWTEDSGIYKVTCQAENQSAEKGKRYQEVELPLPPVPAAHRDGLLELACMLHNLWKEQRFHLLEGLPAITIWDEAEQFLQRYCKTVVELGESCESYTITCQAENQSAEKGKRVQQYKAPLMTIPQSHRGELFELSLMMFRWWKEQRFGENA